MRETGTGAAPDMHQRMLSVRPRASGGTWSMKFNIAGTARQVLMRSRSMSSQARRGSKLRMFTSVPPLCTQSVAGVRAPT